MSGNWKPCLFSAALSAGTDANSERKSMTHIWSFHLFSPKPERLKCLSVGRCPLPVALKAVHTRMLAHAQANTQIPTNQAACFDLPLSTSCSPSIFLSCHFIVNVLLKTLNHNNTTAHKIFWNPSTHTDPSRNTQTHMHNNMETWTEELTFVHICVLVMCFQALGMMNAAWYCTRASLCTRKVTTIYILQLLTVSLGSLIFHTSWWKVTGNVSPAFASSSRFWSTSGRSRRSSSPPLTVRLQHGAVIIIGVSQVKYWKQPSSAFCSGVCGPH